MKKINHDSVKNRKKRVYGRDLKEEREWGKMCVCIMILKEIVIKILIKIASDVALHTNFYVHVFL